MLTMLLVIFVTVFISIVIYLNLPSKERSSGGVGGGGSGGVDTKAVLPQIEHIDSNACTEITRFKNVKRDILHKLEEMKSSVDKEFKQSEGQNLQIINHINILENELKNHFELPIQDIMLLRDIIAPLKDKLPYSEINTVFNIVKDIENIFEKLMRKYTQPLQDIINTLNVEFANSNIEKTNILDKLDIIRGNLNEKLPRGSEVISHIEKLIEELKIKFDFDGVKDTVLLINEKLSKIETDSVTVKNDILNKLGLINSALNGKMSTEISNHITNLEEKIKSQLEVPTTSVNDLKTILLPITEKLSLADFASLTNKVNNIESKIEDIFPPITTTTIQTPQSVNHKEIEIMNQLETIKSALNGKLPSKIEEVNIVNEIKDLGEQIKTLLQKPTSGIGDLKTILETLKVEFSSTDYTKMFNIVNNLESKFKKTLTDLTKAPLDSINSILQQFKSADLKKDITSLDATLKSKVQNVITELNVLKTLCTSIEKPSGDNLQISNQLTTLETSFKTFMEQPIRKISEILEKLSAEQKLPSANIHNEILDLKNYFIQPIEDITLLRDIFKPIKDKLTSENIGNIVGTLRDIESRIVQQLGNKIEQIDQKETINYIDSKEKNLKQLYNSFFKNTHVMKNVKLASKFVDILAKTTYPSDWFEVFHITQKFCKYFEEFIQLTRLELNIDGNKFVKLSHLLENIKNKQKTVIQEIVGTDFVSFKNSIDLLSEKTLSRDEFHYLQDVFLNNADGNFQRLEQKLDDLMINGTFITKAIDMLTNEYRNSSTSIKKDINSLSEALEKKIDLVVIDIKKSIKDSKNK